MMIEVRIVQEARRVRDRLPAVRPDQEQQLFVPMVATR
jgi:hypothetical protein